MKKQTPHCSELTGRRGGEWEPLHPKQPHSNPPPPSSEVARGHRNVLLGNLSPQLGIIPCDKKPGARDSPQVLDRHLGCGFPTQVQKLSHNCVEGGGRSPSE